MSTKHISNETLREHVLAGISWLDDNAPKGWEHRLMKDGKFQAKIGLAETGVLPLVFKGDRFAEYMTDVGICKHFGFSFQFRVTHGFLTEIASQELFERLQNVWEQELLLRIQETRTT